MRSGLNDNVARSPTLPTLTLVATTISPESVFTVAIFPFMASTVPIRRLFSPMKFATNEFSGFS